MFIIKAEIANKYFMKDHEKVITFNLYEDAYNFLTGFDNYAKIMAIREAFSNPNLLMEIHQEKYEIISLPENFDKPTIDFDECKKG